MSGLSPEQERIRTAPGAERIVVRAVAGAGKTRVLVERAQYLVGQGAAAPRILFVTFSASATQELRRRLNAVGLACRVTTLHDYARQQLGDGVRSLDTRDARWRGILAELDLRHARLRPLEAALQRIWQAPPGTLDDRHLELQTDAERRIGALDDPGIRLLTYGQQLAHLERQWAADPQRLGQARSEITHVIVDEVQDVSAQQWRIIETLAGDRPVMAVGDEWQGIYGFQGADAAVLRSLAENAAVYTLATTWRCPAQHTLLADALTGQATVPARGFDGELRVHRGEQKGELYDALQEDVRRTVDRWPGEAVAVLVGTNTQVETVRRLLTEIGVPVRAVQRDKGADDRFVRTALWPAVATMVRRRVPRGRHPLLALPWAGDAGEAEHALLDAAWHTGRAPQEVRAVLRSPSHTALSLLALWERLASWSGPPAALPELLQAMFPKGGDTDYARHLCVTSSDASELFSRLGGAVPAEYGQVEVCTVHASKGREWHSVVVFDDGSPPHPDEDLQEAVRVRYVALTRSTFALSVVLHRDGHPALTRALAPDVLARIRLLERAFRTGPLPHDPALALALRHSPALATYLRNHAQAHLPPERCAWLAERAGITLPPPAGPSAVSRRRLA